jgi:Trypsin-co-occurring domain 1
MAFKIFKLNDGSEVVVEVSARPGQKPVSRISDFAEGAKESFERSIDAVYKMISTFYGSLQAEGKKPNDITIEFGLKATTEVSGLMIAKATADANFKVSLSWKTP